MWSRSQVLYPDLNLLNIFSKFLLCHTFLFTFIGPSIHTSGQFSGWDLRGQFSFIGFFNVPALFISETSGFCLHSCYQNTQALQINHLYAIGRAIQLGYTPLIKGQWKKLPETTYPINKINFVTSFL